MKTETLYPGKLPGNTSFNLTARARELVLQGSEAGKMSQSDLIETLIRNRSNKTQLKPWWKKKSGTSGGAGSYFFGKDRGTTTAINLTALARNELDRQKAASGMSRGDYVEFLIRTELGIEGDLP